MKAELIAFFTANETKHNCRLPLVLIYHIYPRFKPLIIKKKLILYTVNSRYNLKLLI